MEMPRRIYLDGRSIEVRETFDQWRGSGYRYCKVKDGDGNLYILRSDESGAEWELTMCQRGLAGTKTSQ